MSRNSDLCPNEAMLIPQSSSTKGRSTPTDYQALVNLSNASRIEAINTFEQLSKRLSRSSSSLVPVSRHTGKSGRIGHRRKARKGSESLGHLNSSRTKSVQAISITPLGPATTDGVSILSNHFFPPSRQFHEL
jgi:hypothetical protein